MFYLVPFRPSVDEDDWDSNRDEKLAEIEDDTTSAGNSRG
jgi:hypothetical protein